MHSICRPSLIKSSPAWGTVHTLSTKDKMNFPPELRAAQTTSWQHSGLNLPMKFCKLLPCHPDFGTMLVGKVGP